jgi:hypothetical protein
MINTKVDPYQYLKSGNESFLMTVGSSSKKYSIPGRKPVLFRPELSWVKRHQLGAIPHVKSRAKKLEQKTIDRGKVIYTNDFQPDRMLYPRAYEIDIRSAYWQTAKILELTSNEIYEKYYGKKGGWKLARNMAIGSLNSTKNKYYCEPGVEIDQWIERIEAPAPKVYRAVCGRVSDFLSLISDLIDIESIFLWVDQIYTTEKPDIEKINRVGKEWGYELKYLPVKVSCLKNKFIVFSMDGKREFMRTKKKNK